MSASLAVALSLRFRSGDGDRIHREVRRPPHALARAVDAMSIDKRNHNGFAA